MNIFTYPNGYMFSKCKSLLIHICIQIGINQGRAKTSPWREICTQCLLHKHIEVMGHKEIEQTVRGLRRGLWSIHLYNTNSLSQSVGALPNSLSICESICSLHASWWQKWLGIQLYGSWPQGIGPSLGLITQKNNFSTCLHNLEWNEFYLF